MNRTGFVPCYITFASEMLTAEDPVPERVHNFGGCFTVSTTTNGSIQEVKNSVTSCLTVSFAHTKELTKHEILQGLGVSCLQSLVGKRLCAVYFSVLFNTITSSLFKTYLLLTDLMSYFN